MYNLHRGKTSHNPNPQPSRRRMTPAEEAKLKEQERLAQNLLIAFFEFKDLDKKITSCCLNSCLDLDKEEKNLEDNEKECLKNCRSKIPPFMKMAKNIFKENDQSFSDFEEKYQRSAAFINPENFLKH